MHSIPKRHPEHESPGRENANAMMRIELRRIMGGGTSGTQKRAVNRGILANWTARWRG
jgi:hypothetical protein